MIEPSDRWADSQMIPVVLVLRSGRERVIGLASTTEGADRILLSQPCETYRKRGLTVYADWSRTPEEVRRENP